MLLIPAIDLKQGHCVRLEQGDMDKATTFSEDPAAMAKHWVSQGARRLHLVLAISRWKRSFTRPPARRTTGSLACTTTAGCALALEGHLSSTTP